jgi:hypothetical protein
MALEDAFDKRDSVIVRVWAACVLLLLILSWKLWLPGFTEFPRVPVFGCQFVSVLLPVHYLASALLSLGLGGCVMGIGSARRWLGLAAIALAVLFLCNQHCLQPWAWQAFVMATLLCGLPFAESKRWLRWLLISIYVSSAAGKFDYQFVHTVGAQFVNTLLGWLGSNTSISAELIPRLVVILPAGEALIALGLSLRKTRRFAAWLAIGLHVVLFALLSPLGLGHQLPVLIWNAVSILLVVWLFLVDNEPKDRAPVPRSGTIMCQLARVFALVVLLGPLLRPVGLWDHWLAWGLYSPSNSRVEAHVSENALLHVDPRLEPFFVEEQRYGVRRLALKEWSLKELGVPIYPQARFQKEAIAEILRRQNLTSFAEVIEYGQAHPLTGARSKVEVDLTE